jgi:endonuclease YncB( thermonuclease family)
MFKSCFSRCFKRSIPENIKQRHNKIAPSVFFESEDLELPPTKEAYTPFKWIGGPVNARVLDVYDGDTVTLGFRMNDTLTAFQGRLMGIDTPEIRTRNEQEKAKGLEAKTILIRLVLDKDVIVWFAGNDKYGGRALIHMYTEDWVNVSDYMLKNAPCKAYDGGKKEEW